MNENKVKVFEISNSHYLIYMNGTINEVYLKGEGKQPIDELMFKSSYLIEAEEYQAVSINYIEKIYNEVMKYRGIQ